MNLRNPLMSMRVTEKDIRDQLTSRNYRGTGAKFEQLDLFAIERPGWIQVFKFVVSVTDDNGDRHRFYGVLRDDQRSTAEMFLGSSEQEQAEVAEDWSTDLITARREPLHAAQIFLLAVFGLVISLAVVGAVVTALN